MNGFDVAKILDFRYNDRAGRQEWKVKWKGFDLVTWEAWEPLVSSKKFQEYLRDHGEEKQDTKADSPNSLKKQKNNSANYPFPLPCENENSCIHRGTASLIRKNYDQAITHIKNAYSYGKKWTPQMIYVLKEAWKAQVKGERICYRKMEKLLAGQINPQLGQILKYEQHLISKKMLEISKSIETVGKSAIKENNNIQKPYKHFKNPNDYETIEDSIDWYIFIAEHYSYLIEMCEGEDCKEAKFNAKKWYAEGYEVAYQGLLPHNLILLQLVIVFSNFLVKEEWNYEVAIEISQKAFDLGVKEAIESKNQSKHYLDMTETLQKIKDNISIWKQSLIKIEN